MFIALALYTSWVKAMLQCLAWMSPMKHNCYFLYDRCTCSGCPSLLSFITVVIQAHASWLLALFPGILLKNGGRREPGNICGKRCWLPAPGSGSTTQIAEQNHKYTWHFVHSAKNCQLENQLISTDWTSKVGEKQFSNVWKGCKSRQSKIKIHCSWLPGPAHSPCFTVPSLHVKIMPQNSNRFAGASRTKNYVVNSFHWYCMATY